MPYYLSILDAVNNTQQALNNARQIMIPLDSIQLQKLQELIHGFRQQYQQQQVLMIDQYNLSQLRQQRTHLTQKFTDLIQQQLNSVYQKNPKPSKTDLDQMVEITGLSLHQLRIWFQNKRSRSKSFSSTPTNNGKSTQDH